jgi:hypothetical protein
MRPAWFGPRNGVVGAVLALAVLSAGAAAAVKPEAVIGFGPFTFGMSVADAMHAVPRARLTRCAFPDHFTNCVEYDDKVYTMPAIVRARFAPDQKLDAVFVQFDRLAGAEGSQACRKTAVAALRQLREEYGPNTTPNDSATADAKAATTAKPKGDDKGAAKTGAAKPGATKDAKSSASSAPAPGAGRSPDLFLWYGARTGKIGLVDLCTSDDSGVVYMIFTPSSIPGREAF